MGMMSNYFDFSLGSILNPSMGDLFNPSMDGILNPSIDDILNPSLETICILIIILLVGFIAFVYYKSGETSLWNFLTKAVKNPNQVLINGLSEKKASSNLTQYNALPEYADIPWENFPPEQQEEIREEMRQTMDDYAEKTCTVTFEDSTTEDGQKPIHGVCPKTTFMYQDCCIDRFATEDYLIPPCKEGRTK